MQCIECADLCVDEDISPASVAATALLPPAVLTDHNFLHHFCVRPTTMADKETFQILRITARSDHPVRNTAGELIFGNHVLWEGDNANDRDGGSTAPNVFSYDFKPPSLELFTQHHLKVNRSFRGWTTISLERWAPRRSSTAILSAVDPTLRQTSGTHSTAVNLPWNQVTQQVFSSYSKIYDTVEGRPRFGVNHTGGHFEYSYYIQPAPGGAPGSPRQPWWLPISYWLFMNPYGFINTTYLVGVNTPCNNPFFDANNSPPLIGVNDTRRKGFGNHAFNGSIRPFNRQNPDDRIFDACGGPQLGTRNPTAYVNAAIDRATNLYQLLCDCPAPRLEKSKMSTKMGEFIQSCTISNAKPYSQIRWDDVATWAKRVLGTRCEVAFAVSKIGNGVAERLWHLTGVDGIDGDVVVRVRAETHVAEDGDLDVEKSSRAAFDNFAFTLKDMQFDLGPETTVSALCMPPPFDDFAHYALQHASHIPEGHFLIASGNHMISITGGSSSAALEPVRGSNETVAGVGSTFNVHCHVDDLVGAASADVEGHGLLLNKYHVETNEAGKKSTVTFTFVTRLVGTHDVDLRFAQASTMTASSKRIQVTVVEADV
ncbi:hypothetical protein LshimejAT787_0201500 [Lyophyllum shimeji]|uniref:Uncharacterized protein n=1 Tax=Lyophyllum shimeji TaxID=47721 RepID=A0A9P3UKK7_LYOSH|nr:hypothetical protein LshimejAT787_0201500 [Lyophyllum shimeji]